MEDRGRHLKAYLPWFFLLFFVEAFTGLLLWLGDIEVFSALLPLLLLFSFFLFFLLAFFLSQQEKKREKALLFYLESPDRYHEEFLKKAFGRRYEKGMEHLIIKIKEEIKEKEEYKRGLLDYENYVETWAHEIKIPLSLLTLFIDNRKEEMEAEVYGKLDYIRSGIKESVGQMLVYSKVKGSKKDYLFENLKLSEALDEVFSDFAPLLSEKKVRVKNEIKNEEIFTDRRALRFILAQAVSNAIKYGKEGVEILVFTEEAGEKKALVIRDNGIGVKACDFPYIFEKGFTGDTGDSRKKATGMGLFLAKRLAEDTGLVLQAESEWGKGFSFRMIF